MGYADGSRVKSPLPEGLGSERLRGKDGRSILSRLKDERGEGPLPDGRGSERLRVKDRRSILSRLKDERGEGPLPDGLGSERPRVKDGRSILSRLKDERGEGPLPDGRGSERLRGKEERLVTAPFGRGSLETRAPIHPRLRTALVMAMFSAMLAPPGHAQSNPAQSFEVASVKIGAPIPIGENYNINLGTVSHGTLTLTNTTLADCLRFAYSLTSDSLIAGPAWIKSKEHRYTIVAKAASERTETPETSRAEMLRMLQVLLTERFKLEFHHEPREMNYYALVPSKKGPKIELAKDGNAGTDDRNGGGHIVRRGMSMLMLATLIARFEFRGATVLDETGLKGLYGVNLQWTPGTNLNADSNADGSAGPSIFTALQEQLGLKLESKKGPVEVMVIDHAEINPVEN